jgi:hypothetical protein
MYTYSSIFLLQIKAELGVLLLLEKNIVRRYDTNGLVKLVLKFDDEATPLQRLLLQSS